MRHTFHRISARAGLSLLCALGLAWPVSGLSAQIACSGPGCALLPVSQAQYDRLYSDFYDQYVIDLFDRNAHAAVVANLMSPPIGTVNLYGFTGGVNVGAGYHELEEKTITSPGVGTFDKVPSAGAAANLRAFGGFNLGALLGRRFDPHDASRESSPGFFSLSRFDMYVSGMRHTESLKDESGIDGTLRMTVENRGGELRYHLVESTDIVGGPMLRWLGVSVGVGYYETKFRMGYASRAPETVTLRLENGANLKWSSIDVATFTSEVESVPLEIRTGIQLLYFVNLTTGFGISRNRGFFEGYLLRTGSFTPETELVIPGFSASANLGMSVYRRAEVPSDLYYVRAGLEFNILALKIGVEALKTRRDYGATAAVRIEF